LSIGLSRRYTAEGALILAAFFFGVTFPVVHDALEDVTPFGYLLVRFTIAVIVLAPFGFAMVRADREQRRLLLRVGFAAGVLLFGGYAMQTVGLQYTSPSSSAFITGLYVAMTPVVESIVRRRPPPWEVCFAIVVATGGLFMLTGADLNFGKGELFTLACAALFAIWIVLQGAYANRVQPVPFVSMQMVVVVLLCVPAAGVQGTGNFTGIAIFAAAFTGIACSSVALSLQLYGQKRIAPSRAALILLSEPVFAGIAGYVDGERLSALQLGGAAVILVGIAIAELAPGRARADAEDARVEADLEARLR
jgi:drug/metabolite transporter (DMT)-like permease